MENNLTKSHINIVLSCQPRKALRHAFGNNLKNSQGCSAVLRTRHPGQKVGKAKKEHECPLRAFHQQVARSTRTRLLVLTNMIHCAFGQIARAGSYDEMRKVALPIVWRSHGSDMPLNFLMMPSEAENDRGKIHWSTPIARPSR